ncbi:nucleotidyltransferase, partial [Streptomyces sp. SID11233]|nr:nucleotidyltransferase [Streptomyces sp. SID11233]
MSPAEPVRAPTDPAPDGTRYVREHTVYACV